MSLIEYSIPIYSFLMLLLYINLMTNLFALTGLKTIL